ncbi:hypothetical protein J6590_082730 [Homalodisca vitripennis]|nr:hypothetical protein J6590_082730 [Homalodisca vitripennis]
MSIELLAHSNLCTNDVQNQKVLPIKHRPLPLGALTDLKRCLDTLDWVSMLSDVDSETSYNRFHQTFVYWLDIHLPEKKIKPSKKPAKRAKWYTPELDNLKNIVMSLFRRSQTTGLESDINSYKIAKKHYKIALCQAKKKFNENFIATASNKCKAAWQVIKMESGASSATHAAPDADNLNKFFTAGVEEVRRSIQPTNTSAIDLIQTQIPVPTESFRWNTVSPSDIVSVVARLKSTKSCDIYNMSAENNSSFDSRSPLVPNRAAQALVTVTLNMAAFTGPERASCVFWCNFRYAVITKYAKYPPSRPTIYEWHSCFVETGCSVKHKKSSGRPSTSDEVVEQIDEDDRERNVFFMQDGAPPHYLTDVRDFLNDRFPGQWIGRDAPIAWPPVPQT